MSVLAPLARFRLTSGSQKLLLALLLSLAGHGVLVQRLSWRPAIPSPVVPPPLTVALKAPPRPVVPVATGAPQKISMARASRQPLAPAPLLTAPQGPAETSVPPAPALLPRPAEAPAERAASPTPAPSREAPPRRFGAGYLNNPPPPYPALARRLKLQGTVMLRVTVSREGAARAVEVDESSGSPLLDQAAAQAVRNWRFTPARLGDVPVEEAVRVPVSFRLE